MGVKTECTQCHYFPLEEITDEDQFGRYSNGRHTISVDGEERYCPKCDIYFMICDRCTQDNHRMVFRKFLGTEGTFVRPEDEAQYDRSGYTPNELMVYAPNCVLNPDEDCDNCFSNHTSYDWDIVEPWGKAELSKYLDEIAGDDLTDDDSDSMILIPYYVGFMDLFHLPRYLNSRRVWPTGPDGNFEHYWKCVKCESVASCCDH